MSKKPVYYVLKGKEPVPVYDVLEWAESFDIINRILKQEEVNGYFVSTVFLGIDHSFGYGDKPVLFETMAFKKYNRNDNIMNRYCTWDEAMKGHEEMKGHLLLDDLFYRPDVSDIHITSTGRVKQSKNKQFVNRLKRR